MAAVAVDVSRLRNPARAVLEWLRPLDNGPQEIRSMDGLRALAALSVVAFHTMLALKLEYKHIINNDWYYLATGVHLFFVLSGFLLFLPYARAMLQGKALSPALRFYRRRALRIFPAYWVCLAVLAVVSQMSHDPTPLLPDVAVHLGMIHDDFPLFNRALEGPFWTLAVEWQFYMLLPFIAAAIARLVAKSRSAWRVVLGIFGMIAAALLIRSMATVLMALIPLFGHRTQLVTQAVVLFTLGTQGKYLEVFGIGMLCAVLYIVVVEQRRVPIQVTRWLGYLALAAGVVLYVLVAPFWEDTAASYGPGNVWTWHVVLSPLFVGLGYGALALAALWGSRIVRWPFEFAPLRFIGHISYSLYLWHLPCINAMLPGLQNQPIVVRLICAFVLAYLSYQLVERPFLKRRHRAAPTSQSVETSGNAYPGRSISREIEDVGTTVSPS